MTAKPKTGRPSKFRPEFIDQAKELALLGLTDAEMARVFDVSEQTLNTWKKEKDGFLASIKAGKDAADAKVAASLFHRALGYSHEEDDIRAVNGEIVITPTVKHYPPDPTSMIFWLKNRQPAKWRDKPSVEESDDAPIPVRVEISVKDARIRDDDQPES